MNSSSDMITVIDSAGHVVYVSPSVERTLDAAGGPLEGTPLTDLIHHDDRGRAVVFIAAVARDSGPAEPVEWRMRGADGFWVEVETIATGQLDDPDVQGIVLNSRNVTERKRLEAQLRQSQRLESVGQLAGGIAHDFNNFLSVIRGYARFLVEGAARRRLAALGRRGDREGRRARLARSRASCSCSAAARSCSTASSTSRQVLSGVMSLLARTLGEDVALHTEVGPTALARRGRSDAGGAGAREPRGKRARRDARPAASCTSRLGERRATARPGRAVKLTVRDTGSGMTRDVVERAFEPFYTTKPKGQGTGLGLATVYGIVTQAGGTIEIESTPDKGTRVVVLLPATDADAATPSRPPPRPTARPRGARRSWWSRTRRPCGGSPAASSRARATGCSRPPDGRARSTPGQTTVARSTCC